MIEEFLRAWRINPSNSMLFGAKNLEKEIRNKTIDEVKIRTITKVFDRHKGKDGYFNLGKSIQQELFEDLIEEMKGNVE